MTRSTGNASLTARRAVAGGPPLRGRRTGMRETLVAPLLRLSWVIVLVAVAAGAAGYLLSGMRAPVYTASTLILFKDAGVGLRADGIERVLASRAQLAGSRQALERVVATVPGTRRADLEANVTVTPDPDAFGLQVVAKAPTARRAAGIADAVTAAYVDGQAAQAEQTAKTLRASYGGRLADLDRRIAVAQAKLQRSADRVATIQLNQLLAERLRLDSEAGTAITTALVAGTDVADTGKAIVPLAPTSPRPVQDGIISGLAGALLAAGLLLERNRRAWGNVLDAADLSHVLSIPLLGEISSEANPSPGSTSALGLAVSRLRIAAGTDGGVFVLTSTVEGVDATRAARLLAEAAARTSWWPVALLQRTLAFGGAWGPPLAGSSDDSSLSSLERGRVTRLPYGPVETAELLLVRLRDQGALVIVDGPPAQRRGDSSRLALAADAIVVVVADDQPIQVALDALEILSLLTTPVLGYIRVTSAPAVLAAPRWSAGKRDDLSRADVEDDDTDTDTAVADAPEADAPKADASETNASETNASETDASETDAPETDAPAAATPDTDALDAAAAQTADTPDEGTARPAMPFIARWHPSAKYQGPSWAAPRPASIGRVGPQPAAAPRDAATAATAAPAATENGAAPASRPPAGPAVPATPRPGASTRKPAGGG